ncbi:MAG: hypothetical protein CME65_05295 [Halobacteriovoraceae bacterium]|nr:hypothetical protein [Halobacteriovoraceae bacterium]
MLKLFKLFALILCTHVYAHEYLNTSQLPNAQNRIPLKSKDFFIDIKADEQCDVRAMIDPSSINWFRFEDILLIPMARIKIRTKRVPPAAFITYKERTLNFQHSEKYSYAELNISLFENQPIEIKLFDKVLSIIDVQFRTPKKPKVLVDYSCSRNGIQIEGLENEYFSIGCRTKRIGKFGKEKPMLEVIWLSPDLRIKNSKYLPYHAAFLSQRPVQAEVENRQTGKSKVITIKAKIPKRLHRLFTAYGFGPYAFETELIEMDDDGNEISRESKTEPTVPALMFYINYKISETQSIRGFEAAVFKDSVFNNAGIYLGSDFGFALDNRLYFSTLIGVQHLYFQFDKDSEVISEPIFPQGIEFMYRHAFDDPNYIVSGGVFLSPTESIDYTNAWVRWGKNYFWELNYISWGKEEFKATTYGVSIGFPFKGFL